VLRDVGDGGQFDVAGPNGKVAHLAFYASWVAATAAGHDAFLQDLVKRCFVKAQSVLSPLAVNFCTEWNENQAL